MHRIKSEFIVFVKNEKKWFFPKKNSFQQGKIDI